MNKIGYLAMIKWILILLVIPLSILCSRERNNEFNCSLVDNKETKYITFVLSSIFEGDKYEITFDDGSYYWESGEYKHFYFTDYKNLKYIVKRYCTVADSIKIKMHTNSVDTVLYIPTKNLNMCFIGSDINGKLLLNYYRKDSIYVTGFD